MAFTSIEIIALVLIVVVAIKMLVLLVKPKAWMNFAKAIYKKKAVAVMIGLVLGGVVLYYLIQELTIVQILAVIAFMAALFMIGLSGSASDLIKKYEGQIKRGKLWKENWFYTLLWIALIVWGALVLFNVI